jgi:hypothetical protein
MPRRPEVDSPVRIQIIVSESVLAVYDEWAAERGVSRGVALRDILMSGSLVILLKRLERRIEGSESPTREAVVARIEDAGRKRTRTTKTL